MTMPGKPVRPLFMPPVRRGGAAEEERKDAATTINNNNIIININRSYNVEERQGLEGVALSRMLESPALDEEAERKHEVLLREL